MNAINHIAAATLSTKNFVARHKTAVAVATTVTVMTVINRKALGQHNDFLKEHGLYEAFYTPENSY